MQKAVNIPKNNINIEINNLLKRFIELNKNQ